MVVVLHFEMNLIGRPGGKKLHALVTVEEVGRFLLFFGVFAS
jgi:hypothetical protein